MFSAPAQTAATDRARWLAELAETLDHAHRLLFELELQPGIRPEALELHFRIEAARLEVQSLRLSRQSRAPTENGSQWTGFTPWRREGSD